MTTHENPPDPSGPSTTRYVALRLPLSAAGRYVADELRKYTSESLRMAEAQVDILFPAARRGSLERYNELVLVMVTGFILGEERGASGLHRYMQYREVPADQSGDARITE